LYKCGLYNACLRRVISSICIFQLPNKLQYIDDRNVDFMNVE